MLAANPEPRNSPRVLGMEDTKAPRHQPMDEPTLSFHASVVFSEGRVQVTAKSVKPQVAGSKRR
jgi:hypothetical protein